MEEQGITNILKENLEQALQESRKRRPKRIDRIMKEYRPHTVRMKAESRTRRLIWHKTLAEK